MPGGRGFESCRGPPLKPVIYVRVRRPNGDMTEMTVHQSKLQEVMDAANRHFGSAKVLGGPSPVKVKGK